MYFYAAFWTLGNASSCRHSGLNVMRMTKWCPLLLYSKTILRCHSNSTFKGLLSCCIKPSHWACQHSYGHNFECCGSCSQHVILSTWFFSVDFLVCKKCQTHWHDGDSVCIGDSLHTLSERKFCLQCQTDMTRVSLFQSHHSMVKISSPLESSGKISYDWFLQSATDLLLNNSFNGSPEEYLLWQ